MNKKRLLELLAYAKVCFDHCTSPFATDHLVKKNVTAKECRELSAVIAEALLWYIEDDGYNFNYSDIKIAFKVAEKEFAETQT